MMADRPPSETLIVAHEPQGIVVVTFNRPEVRNALDRQMIDELHGLLDAIRDDRAVRAVIFTGAGDKAFTGGADIAQLRERTSADALQRINAALFRRVEQLPMPTIAAIRGYCLGGGCEIATACDIRIAGEGAKLGQPEVGLGIIPGAGGCYRLPRLVGWGRARELIFSGRIIDAAEALRIGLVERVVPDAEVLDAARALAGEIAANSPLAVRLAKAVLCGQGEMSVEVGLAFEAAAQAICFDDEEKQRRMTAFVERGKQRTKRDGAHDET